MGPGENLDQIAAMRAAKKTLRQTIRRALNALPQDLVETQSKLATKVLLELPEYQRAKSLSVYLSMDGKELSTTHIVQHAMRSGKKIYVPYIHKTVNQLGGGNQSIMDMLTLQSEDDYKSLELDSWGIPTLSASTLSERENCFGGRDISGSEKAFAGRSQNSKPCDLDLIIMPGMAFDMHFGRLGHGKGYYDRFLSRLHSIQSGTESNMPALVALCLKEQLLPDDETVPTDSSDWRVDALVVGSGKLFRAKS